MRYVVIGAGAIGGVVGGLLADSGHEVALVARGAHGEAIRDRGLEVRRPDRRFRVRPRTAATVSELGLASGDVLLLAVKSQQTAGLLDEIAALEVDGARASDALPILHLQNGVANEDAALRMFAAVHGVCVNLPATHLEPGVVIGEGDGVAGILQVGLAPGGSDVVDRAVAADLTSSGFRADVVDDVMAFKRAKLLRNLGNALDALCGSDLPADQEEIVDALAARAAEEGLATFAAAALPVVDDARWNASLGGGVRTTPVDGQDRRGGSTWQSVARGQGSVETDHLNGEIVRLGRLHGVPTPVNLLLQREMWRLVAEGARPGSRRAADLLAALTS